MQKYSEKYNSEIKIELPDQKEKDVSKGMEVFLNKEMYFNRLTNFLLAKHFFEKEFKSKKAVDLMCASGILSIALQKDLGINTIANDLNPSAIKLVEKNTKLNNVKIKTSCIGAELFSISNEDFFIIDPFGSPAKALENVIKNCKINSIICSTATDIAVLSGKYPKKSLEVYNSEIRLNGFADEMRIRSLLGFCEIIAKQNNKSIMPLFCYTKNHYVKICIKIIEKDKKNNLGFVYYNPKTGEGFVKKTKQRKESVLDFLESNNIWISKIKNIDLDKISVPNLISINNKNYINIKKYYQYKKRSFPKKLQLEKCGNISPYNYTLFLKNKGIEKLDLL